MAGQSVVISVLAETSKFSKGFDDVGRTTNKLGGAWSKLGAGLAIGTGAALLALGKVGVDAFKANAEVDRLNKQTDAAIKSTGGQAGKTSSEIQKVADQLERMTGIERESVQEGQNVLLTFTKIQGVNFDEATKAALDMSVALGTDMASASMTVGKALNDPLVGLSKLTKQGVTFTQQQKDQVKALVAAGDVMGAQKVILEELNTEYGGSAEAFGESYLGKLEKVKNAFGNITEELVSGLLPAGTDTLGKIEEYLNNILDSEAFGQFVDDLNIAIESLIKGEGPAADFFKTVVDGAKDFSPLLKVFEALKPILPEIADVLEEVGTALGGALKDAAPEVADALGELATEAADLVTELTPTIGPLGELAGELIELAAALVPVALILLPNFNDETGDASGEISGMSDETADLVELLEGLADAVEGAAAALTGATDGWELTMKLREGKIGLEEFNEELGNVGGPVGYWIDRIQDVAKKTAEFIGPGVIALAVLKNQFDARFSEIQGKVTNVVGVARARLLTWMAPGISQLSALGSAVSQRFNDVIGQANTLRLRTVAVFSTFGSILYSAGVNLIQGLINGISATVGRVFSTVANIAGGIVKTVQRVLGIKSPSRVMMKVGDDTISGLVNGLVPDRVTAAMGRVGAAVVNGYDVALAAPSRAVQAVQRIGALVESPVTAAGLESAGYGPGGNTYNITLPQLLIGTDVGRAIVEAIEEWERKNGKRS